MTWLRMSCALLLQLQLLQMPAWCTAAEVTLDLPEPLIPHAVMSGSVRITDPPARVSSVDLPTVPGLEWQLSGESGSSVVMDNGRSSSVTTVGIVVRASQRGALALPSITVRCSNGSELTSAPRSLRVDDGDTRLVGEAIAEVAFEPASIVPGQSCKLIYRAYLHGSGVHIDDPGIAPPDGAIRLAEPVRTEGRTFDAKGSEWSLTTYTWQLTFAAPGAYTVRGQQEYQVVTGRNVFNQHVQRRQVAVAPATLTVEPLPVDGRPADYAGLIGPLSALANLDRERVSAGEGAVLSVTVTGWQTNLIKRPTLHLAGAQHYAKDDQSGDGTRSFTWDVVPATVGSLAIPAFGFPYFDPGSRSYRTAATAALTLTVIPGRSRHLGVVGQAMADPVTETAAAPPAPVLPAPLRGTAAPRPPIWLTPAVLALGALFAPGVLLLRRLAVRRGGPHRGRALRRATGDPAALVQALQALLPALTTPAQQTAARALQAALDRHRFGGEPLPELESWLRELERVA